MKRHVISLVLCLLTIYTTGSVANTVMFVVEDLGVLPGYEHSMATAVNAGGQVVGVCWNGPAVCPQGLVTRAFIWESGIISDIGTLDSSLDGSYITDINDMGTAIGYCLTYGRRNHYSFTWTRADGMCALYLDPSGEGKPIAINNLGHIVGIPSSGIYGCVLYRDDQVIDIFGSAQGWPSDINSEDVVTGTLNNHAFRWEEGVVTTLAGPDGLPSRGYAIADVYNGLICGSALCDDESPAYTGYEWLSNGLGLRMLDSDNSRLYSCLKDATLLVGSVGDGENERAGLWGNRRYLIGYLDQIIPPGSDWRLVRALSIARNDAGSKIYIVGLGVNPDGQMRAFLLKTPDGPICGDIEHQYPQADLNYDCRVEWADFGIFAANWQCTDCSAGNDWCQGADLGKDGVVGWNDFVAFGLHWQECSAPECD